MKKYLFTLLVFFTILKIQAQTSIFDALLKKHVNNKGLVDYKSFKNDEKKLNAYLDYLAKTIPDKTWSANKEKAFWINAYNAYTIKTILDHYPIKSILKIKKKGKDAWNILFAKVAGNTYTLNAIENKILRTKFNDPRIHVGINCASESCPQLGNFAFTENNVNQKLEELMHQFVNDSTRNQITKKKLKLSKIFDWFKSDFTKKGSLINFLNKYSDIKIDKKAKKSFLTYHWNLNEQ